MVFCNNIIRRYTGKTLLKKALALQCIKKLPIVISGESKIVPKFISLTLTPKLDIQESVIDEVIQLKSETDNEADFVLVSAPEKGRVWEGIIPSHEKENK